MAEEKNMMQNLKLDYFIRFDIRLQYIEQPSEDYRPNLYDLLLWFFNQSEWIIQTEVVAYFSTKGPIFNFDNSTPFEKWPF